MARSRSETRAASKQVADLDAIVQRGDVTYRVTVGHKDNDHDVASVPFHFGPAYNAGYASTVAEVLDVPVGEVDLVEQARKGLAKAREEYPKADGYEAWLEVVYPAGDDTHEIRRLED